MSLRDRALDAAIELLGTQGLKALTHVPKVRRPTAPTKGSQRRRLDAKKRAGEKKALRGKKALW